MASVSRSGHPLMPPNGAEIRGTTIARDDGAGASVFIVAPGGVKEKGGIGRLIASMARYWIDSGTGPAFRIIDPYGPNRLAVMPFHFLRALGQILWFGLAGRIALLHVHMASKASILRKGLIVHLGRLLGIPVILHLHSPTFPEFIARLPGPVRWMILATMRRAQRVIVLGEVWRRIAQERYGLDPQRVSVLLNAVDGPDEAPPKDHGGPCRILFLGRLEPLKGVETLLEALADARLSGLDWSACLAGRGAVEGYRARAEALGLAGRVRFPGWQPEAEARRLLSEADVFVLPSRAEGLSMAMLEALAFGLAVIVTPVGAAPEVVQEGDSGLFVPPDDAGALAAALARTISEPDLRARLQRGARARFNEKFEISGYCRNLEVIYHELAARGGRG